MDVALDANPVLNDPRMQGNAFHSLLDYLKKTDSRLILSKIVFDEVIARYPERLRSAMHKAIGPVGTLTSLLFDAKVKLPEIDINRETKKLRNKLLRPSHHITSSLIVNNFEDVKTEEVAKRGIERIAPANSTGEELRDVMHWLMLVAYARTSQREIAFITEDKHFRHENALHPHLEQDLLDNNVRLHFYISIDEFIKSHAPAPHNLTESEAFGYYGKSQVMDRFEIEARRFFPRHWPTASSIEIVRRDVQLLRGALYDVGLHSQFGELTFVGDFTVRVTDELFIVNSAITNYTFQPFPQEVPFQGISSSLHTGLTAPLPSFLPVNQFQFDMAPKTDFLFTSVPKIPPPSSIPIVSEFRLKGEIVISMRVVTGKVTNIESERFKIEGVEKTS